MPLRRCQDSSTWLECLRLETDGKLLGMQVNSVGGGEKLSLGPGRRWYTRCLDFLLVTIVLLASHLVLPTQFLHPCTRVNLIGFYIYPPSVQIQVTQNNNILFILSSHVDPSEPNSKRARFVSIQFNSTWGVSAGLTLRIIFARSEFLFTKQRWAKARELWPSGKVNTK